MGRVMYNNSDPSITEEEFEEAAVLMEDDDAEMHRDLATDEAYDTQHGDGHTYNVREAIEQGLTWTPPEDEPVLPSSDRQNVDMAAGFGQSMEDSDPDVERIPSRVDGNDLELQEDVYTALRTNSETAHLNNVTVRVERGAVTLLGTVQSNDDMERVFAIVSELDGVDEVNSRLEVEGL